MERLTLQTMEEFHAAVRAVAIFAAPQCDELCAWLLASFELAPTVQDELMREGAAILVTMMEEDEEIDLPEFGYRFTNQPDPAAWLKVATAAVAWARKRASQFNTE
jgi:hypothetical protein